MFSRRCFRLTLVRLAGYRFSFGNRGMSPVPINQPLPRGLSDRHA